MIKIMTPLVFEINKNKHMGPKKDNLREFCPKTGKLHTIPTEKKTKTSKAYEIDFLSQLM